MRFLRWAAGAIGALSALVLIALVAIYALSELSLRRVARAEVPEFAGPLPTTPADLAEGERIARTRGCFGCHGDRLEGKVFFSVPMVGTIASPNLPTVARTASDAELERAIRHGIGVDGRALLVMPSEMYRVLTDADLARLIAFLRSVPPAPDSTPARMIGPLGRIGLLTGEFHPSRRYMEMDAIPPRPDDPALHLGHYVAWSSCTECHGGDLHGDGTNPSLPVMARGYSPAEFAAFVASGVTPDGRELDLMRDVAVNRLRHLRPDEVASLHAYLVSLPLPPPPAPAD